MTELEILKKYKLEEKFDQQIYSKNKWDFFSIENLLQPLSASKNVVKII